MAESKIKIKATTNEMIETFDTCPSKYYNIRHYDGSANYNGDDEEIIIFDVTIRHNEIGNTSIERKQPYTFDSLEKVLLKKVKEYENESELVI